MWGLLFGHPPTLGKESDSCAGMSLSSCEASGKRHIASEFQHSYLQNGLIKSLTQQCSKHHMSDGKRMAQTAATLP